MSKPKRPRDTNQLAKMIVDLATGGIDEETPESPKVKAGRLGGLKGGVARSKKLNATERSEIARRAAKARWKKTSS